MVRDRGQGTEAAPAAAPVDVIAERVEALRGLRFEQVPRPLAVTGEQARREGLEDLDRDYPPERRRADEAIYKLLGLIDDDADLRELSGSLFGEGVAGYYDPRDGRLRVVEGAGTGNRVLEEIVLAHELTHALEDQRFGLETEPTTDDRTLARTALHEGTATALMYAYVRGTSAPRRRSAGCSARRSRTRATCRRSCRRWCCTRMSAGSSS